MLALIKQVLVMAFISQFDLAKCWIKLPLNIVTAENEQEYPFCHVRLNANLPFSCPRNALLQVYEHEALTTTKIDSTNHQLMKR